MTLDLDKSMPPEPLFCRPGERGQRVEAEVVDQGVPVDLDGVTATFRASWGEGHAEAACEVSGSTVAWRMPEVAGTGRVLTAYVELEHGGTITSTQEVELYGWEAAWT